MQTIADLKLTADTALYEERYADALALYLRWVELQPEQLDARLRVADALMAMGELQRAAVVYTALARNAALAGYPLRALVALNVLAALEPRLGVLQQEIARLYARDSARVGRSVRRALPPLDAPLPAPSGPPLTAAELTPRAAALASSYPRDALLYPEKLIPIPLLSLLAEREFGSVLEALQIVRVRPGTFILREGEPGRSFFVLARGAVEVLSGHGADEARLAELGEGSIFGEMALLSAAPRIASVRAVSDCDLLEFDVAALGDRSATLSQLAEALSGFARERLLANVTHTSPLFRPLDAKQRVDLMRRFVGVEAAPGQPIIREGDPGAGLYVVMRGSVDVSSRDANAAPVTPRPMPHGSIHEGSQRSVALAQLAPPEVFGEIALLTNAPASASVSAGPQGASLLFLSRDYFERLLVAVPELRAYLERLSEDRLLDQRLSLAEVELSAASAADEIDVEMLL
jgi:CRP-like cAMP-binding protein